MQLSSFFVSRRNQHVILTPQSKILGSASTYDHICFCSASAMRIFSWNVNSLVPTVRNVNLKYGSLANFFKELDADIVCLQEVKLPFTKLTKDVVVVEGYQSYWACSEGKTGYSGVTTWARHGCAALSAEADPLNCEGCEREGRCIVTDHGSFVLFNVYVPNAGDRPERARLPAKISFLQALKEKIDVLLASGRQVIAVGDFNVASEQRDVHSAITWDTLYEQQELDALHALFDSCVDSWRHLHPTDEGVYTVWNEKTSARAFNVGLRIDYALCSKGLQQHVKSCGILLDLPPKWSDHAPVLLELDLPAAAAQQQQQQQPVAMWQQLLKQFADPSQRSIASMFRAAGSGKARSSVATSNNVAAHPVGNQTLAPTSPAAPAAAKGGDTADQQSKASGSAAVEEMQPSSAAHDLKLGVGNKRQRAEALSIVAVSNTGKVARRAESEQPSRSQPDQADADVRLHQGDGVTARPEQQEQSPQPQQQPKASQQQQQLEGNSSASAQQASGQSLGKQPSEGGDVTKGIKAGNGRASKKKEQKDCEKSGPKQAKLQSFFTVPIKPK